MPFTRTSRKIRARKIEGNVHFNFIGRQIGARGIPDDQIADTLGPETDLVDGIGCPDSPARQFALHETIGNAVTLHPCDEDQDGEKDGDCGKYGIFPPPAAKGFGLAIHEIFGVGR